MIYQKYNYIYQKIFPSTPSNFESFGLFWPGISSARRFSVRSRGRKSPFSARFSSTLASSTLCKYSCCSVRDCDSSTRSLARCICASCAGQHHYLFLPKSSFLASLTHLLSQHVPLELGQILHGPHIVSPPCPFFPADWLSIEHVCHAPRNLFVLELNPSLRKVRLFCRCKFLPQVRPFRICRATMKPVQFESVSRPYLPAASTHAPPLHRRSSDDVPWLAAFREGSEICTQSRLFLVQS